jgi:8-oxo-dGTP diphosphatase
MKRFNVIMVFDPKEEHVLMCYRVKNPYKGLYNLVGGKVEENESYLDSAYRELFEETGISHKDIRLHPLMGFYWHPLNMEMKVFVGRLDNEVELVEEVHPLLWMSLEENFFDMKKFAGEGNIGHMMEIYHQTKEQLGLKK